MELKAMESSESEADPVVLHELRQKASAIEMSQVEQMVMHVLQKEESVVEANVKATQQVAHVIAIAYDEDDEWAMRRPRMMMITTIATTRPS